MLHTHIKTDDSPDMKSKQIIQVYVYLDSL